MTAEFIKTLERWMTEQLESLIKESERNGKEHLRREYDGQLPMKYSVPDLKKVPNKIASVKIEIYSNETEEPHFKVTYKNCSCRFKIEDCQPMKAEGHDGIPIPIKKIIKYIEFVWRTNRALLVHTWNERRPQDKVLEHQKIKTR